MSNEPPRPIIIKRKRIENGGGHHGGAWKVAYADFVTAMMAFFLLMWLLNATTESQRKGLADYFTPAIPISKTSGGGQDAFWGDDVFAEDTLPASSSGGGEESEDGEERVRGLIGVPLERIAPIQAAQGNRTGAEELLEELHARGGESMAALREMRHVVTRLTEEGLVIDIYERDGATLFGGPDGTVPTALLSETLATTADALKSVSNDIKIAAHMATLPVVQANRPIWELTAARAMAIRLAMEAAAFPAARVRSVAGHADREPVADDPMAIRNNRIEIVLLRDDV